MNYFGILKSFHKCSVFQYIIYNIYGNFLPLTIYAYDLSSTISGISSHK
jgi:hypothetical protein